MIDEAMREHANEVLSLLEDLSGQFLSIEVRLDGKRSLEPGERDKLQRDMTALKNQLSLLSKRGTTEEGRIHRSAIEDAYLQPAANHASVHFKVRIGSDPIRSNWISGLYEPHADIDYFLLQLRDELKEQG